MRKAGFFDKDDADDGQGDDYEDGALRMKTTTMKSISKKHVSRKMIWCEPYSFGVGVGVGEMDRVDGWVGGGGRGGGK